MEDKLNLFLTTEADGIAHLPRCKKAPDDHTDQSSDLALLDMHRQRRIGLDGPLSRRLALERRLHRLANFDVLTGLPTLARVSRLTSRLLTGARRSHRGLTLVSLDLDGLRLVCEAYGHREVEALIKRAACIVRAVVPPDSVVARNGTDGFIVVLVDTPNAADATAGVQRILDAIAVPRSAGVPPLSTTASAGIAMFPGDGEDFDTLSRNAIAAMHEAKADRHRTPRFHTGDVALAARRRLRLETDLRSAVENDELTLFYQPQFDVRTGHGFGVEVLGRWLQGDRVVADPGVFIPMAEQTALIEVYGSWVLHQACNTVRQWSAPGMESLILCVNVSTRQIDETFAALVRRTVERAGFSCDRLELEITESALMGDAEPIIECFRQLKSLGVRIAIDDFGTGYSSLSYLSRLPVDRLKLDKSLIHNLTHQWKDVAILRSVVALGKELGVAVIAEGVETEQQLEVLMQLGCTQVQGFLFGRPAPAKIAYGILKRRWGGRKAASSLGICAVPGRSNAS